MRRHCAAVLGTERRCDETHRFCLLQAGDDIRAFTGGRDGDRNITLPTERLDLPSKYFFKPQVVTGGRERRTVGRQRDCRDRGAIDRPRGQSARLPPELSEPGPNANTINMPPAIAMFFMK